MANVGQYGVDHGRQLSAREYAVLLLHKPVRSLTVTVGSARRWPGLALMGKKPVGTTRARSLQTIAEQGVREIIPLVSRSGYDLEEAYLADCAWTPACAWPHADRHPEHCTMSCVGVWNVGGFSRRTGQKVFCGSTQPGFEGDIDGLLYWALPAQRSGDGWGLCSRRHARL